MHAYDVFIRQRHRCFVLRCHGGAGQTEWSRGGKYRRSAGDVRGTNPANFSVERSNLKIVEPSAENVHLFAAAELAEFFKLVSILVQHYIRTVGATKRECGWRLGEDR